jgi:hypothetical protein
MDLEEYAEKKKKTSRRLKMDESDSDYDEFVQ